MSLTTLLCSACLVVTGLSDEANAEGAGAVDSLIDSYLEKRNAGFLKIAESYQNSLSLEKEKAQQAGDFDAATWIERETLALEKEIDQLRNGEEIAIAIREDPEEVPGSVAAVLQIREAADERKYRGTRVLNEMFLSTVPDRVTALVKANKLSEATKLKEYSDRISAENELIAELLVVEAPQEPSKAPLGAIEFGGHYYKVYTTDEPIEWGDAKRACEREGGQLACIETKEEDEFLIGLISEEGMPGRLWLGAEFGRDLSRTRWLNGAKFDYTNFEKNGYNQGHVCLAYMNSKQWSFRKNRPSLGVRGYICEWE